MKYENPPPNRLPPIRPRQRGTQDTEPSHESGISRQTRVCRANRWVSPGFPLVLAATVFCTTAAVVAEPMCDIETRLYVFSLPIEISPDEPHPMGVVEASSEGKSFEWQGHRFDIVWDDVRIDGERCAPEVIQPPIGIGSFSVFRFGSERPQQYFVPTPDISPSQFQLKTSTVPPGLQWTIRPKALGTETTQFNMEWDCTILGPRLPLKGVTLDVGRPTFASEKARAEATLHKGDFFYHLFPKATTGESRFLLTMLRQTAVSRSGGAVQRPGDQAVQEPLPEIPLQFTNEIGVYSLSPSPESLKDIETMIRYEDGVACSHENVRAFRCPFPVEEAKSAFSEIPGVTLLSMPKVTQLAYSHSPVKSEKGAVAKPTPGQSSRGAYSIPPFELDSECMDEVARGGFASVVTDFSHRTVSTATGEEKTVPVGVAVAVGVDKGAIDDRISVVMAVFERIMTDSGQRRWPVKDVNPTFATREFLTRFEIDNGEHMGFLYPFKEAGAYRVVLFTSEMLNVSAGRYIESPDVSGQQGDRDETQ